MKGRSIEARHVRLYHSLLRTDAWRALDPVARCAYLELAQRYAGTNNGRIPFSVREMAAGLNVGRATAMRALRKLAEHGFIRETRKGAFSQKVRHSTEWRLTEHTCNKTGQLPTREFLHWQKSTVPPEHSHDCRDETVRVPA